MSEEKGFTLVELSIVLVIIGLLIGGILVAQSMIDTAKVQSFIRTIGQYDAAIADFQTKYNALPGDAAAFGCVNVFNGSTCNNGIIEDSGEYHIARYDDNFNSEVALFWYQLNGAESVTPGVTYAATIPSRFTLKSPNPNTPTVALDPNLGIIALAFSPPNKPVSATTHYYSICDYVDGGIADPPGLTGVHDLTGSIWETCSGYAVGGVSPAHALAIDQKMDDGQTNTTDTSWDGKNVIEQGNCDGASNADQYDLTNPTTPRCWLFIKIMSTNHVQY